MGGAGHRVADEVEHDLGVDAAALGGVDGGGALLAQDDGPGDVEDRCLEAGRHGQVDGQREQARPVEVDEGGALAGAGLLGGADVEHAALVDEVGDEGGHRHLGDADLAGQLRAARRAEAPQRLQDQGEVLPSTVRREDRSRGPDAARGGGHKS